MKYTAIALRVAVMIIPAAFYMFGIACMSLLVWLDKKLPKVPS